MSILKEIASEYLIFGDEIIKSSDFDDSVLKNSKTVYEVVRVIDKQYLFFEDHFDRFIKSLSLSGFDELIGRDRIRLLLSKLLEKNKVSDGNIKYLFNKKDNEYVFMAYFMNHKYPTEEEYLNGISTGVFNAERDNPNAKVWNGDLRKNVADIKARNSYYEVLYQNQDGFLTEGSKSTLFFIKNNTICTAPASLVLEGITRKYVIEVCNKLNIDIFESAVSFEDISDYDAAFISGTSPKVLPIKSIDQCSMDVNNITLRSIMQGFDKEILENIT